jgi:AcrR family transcriptional regulator
MPSVGRRPGKQDTRQAIVMAARQAFAEQGYESTSLREIARRAGVDPALVHHYFAGKPALYVEVINLGRDPRAIVEEVRGAAPGKGTLMVLGFLGLWEGGSDDGSRFISAVQAMSSSPEAADGFREFLAERVWSFVADPDEDPDAGALRRCQVASQLFGLAWSRYLIRLEPFASATPEQLAAWVGPTIDRYLADTHGQDPD